MSTKKPAKSKPKKVDPVDKRLTPKEKAFCSFYVELNNGQQAAIKAGYAPNSARGQASRMLTKPHVQAEIAQLREKQASESIATSQQVMEYFTNVMMGRIKDQFGLEASLAERTKAAQELAKRTVDVDNRLKGITAAADNEVVIKVDWGQFK